MKNFLSKKNTKPDLRGFCNAKTTVKKRVVPVVSVTTPIKYRKWIVKKLQTPYFLLQSVANLKRVFKNLATKTTFLFFLCSKKCLVQKAHFQYNYLSRATKTTKTTHFLFFQKIKGFRPFFKKQQIFPKPLNS